VKAGGNQSSAYYLAYYTTLNIEAICSYETVVEFQLFTRCYIPEDSPIYKHSCDNLKSYRWAHNLKYTYEHIYSKSQVFHYA
jgi:hypothetical protein